MVVLADSGVLCAINLEKIVEAHAASGADVTVVVKDGICNGAEAARSGREGRRG